MDIKAVDIGFERTALRANYHEWLIGAWPVIEPAKTFEDSFYIRYVCTRLQVALQKLGAGTKPKDIVICLPPGSTKSTMVTKGLNPWAWTRWPSLRFLRFSHSATLAQKHALKSITILESSWYRHRWPEVKPHPRKWGVTEFWNTKMGLSQCYGVGSSPTGEHGDVLIFDDVIDALAADSDAARAAGVFFTFNVADNRVTSPRLHLKIYMQQRTHAEDVIGYLESNTENWADKYELIIVPADDRFPIHPAKLAKYYTPRKVLGKPKEIEEAGLMDPVRYPASYLKDQESPAKLGKTGYANQYGQAGEGLAGNLINPDWYGRFTLEELLFTAWTAKEALAWRFCLDGANSADENSGNDPTALFAYCYFRGNFYIREIEYVWAPTHEITGYEEAGRRVEGLIERFALRNGYDPVQSIWRVEPASIGKTVVQSIRRFTKMNIEESKYPDKSKTIRIKGILPVMRSRRIFLLQGAKFVPSFLQASKKFPKTGDDHGLDCMHIMVTSELTASDDLGAYGSNKTRKARRGRGRAPWER